MSKTPRAGPREHAMWSSDLQCGWLSWTVVDGGILRLDMPDDNCCDMTGAIKAAEALCPLVWRIDTYAGGKPDTMYLLRGSEWKAVDERAARRLYATYPAFAGPHLFATHAETGSAETRMDTRS